MPTPNTPSATHARSALEVSTDFHVVNRAGTLLIATRSLDLAKERARDLSHVQDGVEVLEITTTVARRRVYRPALRVVA